MRKLTEELLNELEWIVDNDVRYLFYRTAETSERMFRMQYPSPKQDDIARREKHKYHSELGQDKALKSRSQVEKEHKEELTALRKELAELQRRNNIAQREFVANELPSMPDGEEDREAFEGAVEVAWKGLLDIKAEQTAIIGRMDAILSESIEDMVQRRYIEVLTALCWEQATDDGGWEPVWKTVDEFFDYHGPLLNKLCSETYIWVMGGADFFVS